jgi:hypothetical protein
LVWNRYKSRIREENEGYYLNPQKQNTQQWLDLSWGMSQLGKDYSLIKEWLIYN